MILLNEHPLGIYWYTLLTGILIMLFINSRYIINYFILPCPKYIETLEIFYVTLMLPVTYGRVTRNIKGMFRLTYGRHTRNV